MLMAAGVIYYLWVRNKVAGAHGLSGDYSYNPINFPFNLIGNLLGYGGLAVVGFSAIPWYDQAREFLRNQKEIAVLMAGTFFLALLPWLKKCRHFLADKKLLFFSGWVLILLLPFLGLGNMTERYLYLAKFGFVYLLVDWGVKVYRRYAENKVIGLFLLILFFLYLIFNFQQLEETKKDWYQAGEITNKTLL